MIDRAVILRRKSARAEAVALASLVCETLDAAKFPDCRDIIRAGIRKVVGPGDAGTTSAPIQPMTDTQAAFFETTLVPYGIHKGKQVRTVSLDYLLWLADNKDTFHADLRRYCLSRRVQREQDSAAEPCETDRHDAG